SWRRSRDNEASRRATRGASPERKSHLAPARRSGAGALRRRAGRWSVRPQAVRRRGDRAPDPARRRRGPLPRLQRGRLPGAGARRRLPRGRGRDHPGRKDVAADALRGEARHRGDGRLLLRGPHPLAARGRRARHRHVRGPGGQTAHPDAAAKGMSDALVITVAGVGAEVTRAQQPALPLLPAEVAEEYGRRCDAGASIGHVHGRRPDGTPTQDLATFRAYSEAIRARSPILQQFSTGGAVGMGVEERIEALSLKPDMATLTLGTCNFGDEVFE